jgi:erythronate-4-phosphate dehydrogenase
MKIIADANIPFVKEAFSEFGSVTVVPGRQIGPDTVKDAAVLLVRSVTKVDESLLAGSGVKFVGTATIGCDHVDTRYLSDHAIGFAGAPGSNADSVADYLTAALLFFSRAGKRDLSKLTLGIVGAGNVGRRVLKRAQAMGMRCLRNDPPLKRLTQDEALLGLSDVLSESDIISLHVPLYADGPDATAGMVNSGFLSRMKDGAVLINTSRGKVIDEAALKLMRGRLGGFAADVWDNEPSINPETLSCADLATPHIAGYSFDGKIRGTAMIHSAACAFFSHKPEWNADRHTGIIPCDTIDVSESRSPLYKAVKTACDVSRDDARLRRIVALAFEKRAGYFDSLRKNYPLRREFGCHEVVCGKNQLAAANILQGIGFLVKYK